jgi:hypothetical protein
MCLATGAYRCNLLSGARQSDRRISSPKRRHVPLPFPALRHRDRCYIFFPASALSTGRCYFSPVAAPPGGDDLRGPVAYVTVDAENLVTSAGVSDRWGGWGKTGVRRIRGLSFLRFLPPATAHAHVVPWLSRQSEQMGRLCKPQTDRIFAPNDVATSIGGRSESH